MKCVKHGEIVKKVTDQEAAILVKQGWNFCPRKEWKAKVRDVKKATKTEPKAETTEPKAEPKAEPKTEKKSKYAKKQSKKAKTEKTVEPPAEKSV